MDSFESETTARAFYRDQISKTYNDQMGEKP
jgi:hypothetical protein